MSRTSKSNPRHRIPDQPTDDALAGWANALNEWYQLGTNPSEVLRAYHHAFDGRTFEEDDGTHVPYYQVFLCDRDGHWSPNLDTADRESLADAVEELRPQPEPRVEVAFTHGQLRQVVASLRLAAQDLDAVSSDAAREEQAGLRAMAAQLAELLGN